MAFYPLFLLLLPFVQGLRSPRQANTDNINCATDCVTSFQRKLDWLKIQTEDSSIFISERLYESSTLAQLCRAFTRWNNCVGGCGGSQVKRINKASFNVFLDMCGAKRVEFESYQSCYRQSSGNFEVCDTRCGDQEELAREVSRLKAGDVDDPKQLDPIFNKVCSSLPCQIKCVMDVIYGNCDGNRGAAVFYAKYPQQMLRFQVELLRPYEVEPKCDTILGFRPETYQFGDEKFTTPDPKKTTSAPVRGNQGRNGKNGAQMIQALFSSIVLGFVLACLFL